MGLSLLVLRVYHEFLFLGKRGLTVWCRYLQTGTKVGVRLNVDILW